MNYKYKKGQIFGKKLKVPKNIRNSVYNCTLSFNDFIKYELTDKIPPTCLIKEDRVIVERFGIEKAKTLDWILILYYRDARSLLMNIDPSVDDVNASLYELVKDLIEPENYSPRMKEAYPDRLFDLEQASATNLSSYTISRFNNGNLELKDFMVHWEAFKDKDLSYCLKNDQNNIYNITNTQLKEFMNTFKSTHNLIYDNTNIYEFIYILNNSTNESDRKEYLKQITGSILKKAMPQSPEIELANEQYKELFKYFPMDEYLKISHPNFENIDVIIKELETLPQDYVFNTPIPFKVLNNYKVIKFVGEYGLKNIVDFDVECGHFFSKDDCEMLKLMYLMYLEYDSRKKFTKNYGDVNRNYVDGPYTKDEFYEAIRKMIIYGPIGSERYSRPDYSDIIGEFKTRNADLFISEDAPEKLKKSFYTRNITLQLLREVMLENPEINILNFLRDKEELQFFNFGFSTKFYDILRKKVSFDDAVMFCVEYSNIFGFFENNNYMAFDSLVSTIEEANVDEIKRKLNRLFKETIIERDNVAYPEHIPQYLISDSTVFLDSDAPQELQEALYNRTITTDLILSNPDYQKWLKEIDIGIIYKRMSIPRERSSVLTDSVDLIDVIKQTFGKEDSFEIMLIYGRYVEAVFQTNRLEKFKLKKNLSKTDLIENLDKIILEAIIDGKTKYDENVPSYIKTNNPQLFLSQTVPQEIRDKFYDRKITPEDFVTNLDLIEMFGDTNIGYGFPEDLSWIITLFSNSDNKLANYKRLKVNLAYSKIHDTLLQDAFKEYVMENGDDVDVEKIENISSLLERVSLSNSTEIFKFRKNLVPQLLKSDNPFKTLNEIEDIFIKNNLPTVGKLYTCFEILHPDFEGYDFESDRMCPALKKVSNRSKKIVISSDLIKISFGSNNRSVNKYLKNIEVGTKLYESIKSGQIQYDNLDAKQKEELKTFSGYLATLYSNTMKAKIKKDTFEHTDDILADIFELSKRLSPNGNLDYDLADRAISMFCHFAGIDTLEQAKEYIAQKIKSANERNRKAASSDMVLQKGDLVKGIGDIKYLENILQNGSVAADYLGESANSDATPLDTDVSMIMDEDGTTREKLNSEKNGARHYGPIWLVLKNDDRFITTRTNSETIATENDMSKMELFHTGALISEAKEGHYGIRTGFASSEINYIVMENYDPRVGLEIAMNGFYIPIANLDGKIVFTPEDYDKLREKMNGLSYYGIDDYKLDKSVYRKSSEISNIVENMQANKNETKNKADLIKNRLRLGASELGLGLKDSIDLSQNSVILFNTGSTGRFTNLPGDGDYDYTMQVDQGTYSNEEKMNELREKLIRALADGKDIEYSIVNGDIRELKTSVVDEFGNEYQVEIDITFTQKTDKVEYASDVCVSDRLNSIKTEEERNLVKANIILAKQFLKTIGAYKPARKFPEQGGMGGIGVENWILQNGGTLYSAAKSFMETADKCSSFEEFKEKYRLPNFGYNHMAHKRGSYPHDDYIENMNENGYNKMKSALSIYIKNYEENINSPVLETISELTFSKEEVDCLSDNIQRTQ